MSGLRLPPELTPAGVISSRLSLIKNVRLSFIVEDDNQ